MIERPPCWTDGQPCPNHCARAYYDRTVYNLTDLHGPWEGWRFAGYRLISPHGEWIAPYTLDRVLYRRARFL